MNFVTSNYTTSFIENLSGFGR